ncbi:MAG: 30S ribosomal protein S14 [Alphaproteobacteria bacterium]|nr:30S ribosomal protein S14 [Alphaproteobacteria bacterium]
MAKKSLIRRNAKRLKLSNSQKIKRDNLKKIIKNNSISFSERLSAQTKLSELARDGSKIRYRNRCALSGRPRGNLRKFGLSRIAVRELASWGQIPGLIKSSW